MIGSLQKWLSRLGLKLGSLPLVGRIVASVARFTPFVLPGVVWKDENVVLIRHPKPEALNHWLFISRKYIRDISVDSKARSIFLSSVEKAGIPPNTLMCTNLGSRQHFALLHIHCFSDEVYKDVRDLLAGSHSSLEAAIKSIEADNNLEELRQDFGTVWFSKGTDDRWLIYLREPE